MAHELETFANGQTAFASARVSAWHQLGTVTQATMSANEIMGAALLGNWGVRTIPVRGIDVVDGIEVPILADDRRMTVRRNPVTGQTEYLGIVGNDYEVIQNEQCADMLDQLVDQAGGAHFETAGSLRRGKSVLSGSGGALLRRRPLRTVRATRRGTRLKQAAQAVRLVELLARCQRGR